MMKTPLWKVAQILILPTLKVSMEQYQRVNFPGMNFLLKVELKLRNEMTQERKHQ